MVDYTEKRDFQRMTLDSSLEFQVFNDSRVYQGTVKNLSANGLMFTSDKSLPLGIQLSIKLTPENSITPPMVAEVKVIRCDKHSDGLYYVAGEMSQIS
jgi:hypothetical protein